MRFAMRSALALIGLGLALGAEQGIPHASSSFALMWALIAIFGFALSGYVLRLPVVSGVAGGLLTFAATAAMGRIHPLGVIFTALVSALVGLWARQRLEWPLRPVDALFGIALLVMVSLTLSSLIGLRLERPSTNTVGDLVVLYLSTPPWEWGVVLTALLQARYLGVFVRTRYRFSWRYVGAGFVTGVGLIVLTALLVAVESRGFHIRVIANNPFVTTPGLTRGGWGPAIAIALGVIVLAPLAEEALFRGILFGSLSQAWGYALGTIVSAVVFGLAHLNATLFLPLALAGLALNALYRSTDSLVASTTAHMTLNAISVLSALGVLR
ncbi:CPBP family intramembrane glutamic endopeptidase [Sulfobacillus harzensis]|uniref:CPBP family intramembrane metalloprotease n=1 Tax=Sulfobacillus harzensis TaxID=2729629 RepID=A0A7Y0Q261_9FIRM|nr:type II CAAX endopeptidase family protein [Sulfobacillus harzensis]NMP20839.1 CPBP family intramembrane metalloprotease [Sulfobacillus harzensis]